MIRESRPRSRRLKAVFGWLFAILLTFGVLTGPLVSNDSVYADPIEGTTTVDLDADTTGNTTGSTASHSSTVSTGDGCQKSLGAIGWLVCPTTGKITEAVDWLYDKIEDILIINPVEATDGSPIYEIWKYAKGITNIVFIIFLLVVIYSQITGFGISNYGLKKALPKLIVAAVLVNLSFLICSLAVDVSNIIGHGLRDVFTSVEESVVANMAGSNAGTATTKLSFAEMYSAMAGGAALTVAGVAIAFEVGAIWMLIPVVLGAIVAVVSGLITIALRQAVVALLIMISPLAIVAYMLPNTDDLFKKWRKLLTQMLVFYPMFSLLFGASSLAGFAIIASATDGFGLLLGIAVQIFPLFFAWSLMKMSGTFLSEINSRIRGLSATPLAASRNWADSRRQQTALNRLNYGRTPYSGLMRYLDNRKALREANTESLRAIRRNNANTYVQRRIAAGYDGKDAKGTDGNFTPNKYTKVAKDLSNSTLINERTKMDTEHAISNYGSYYVDKKLRDDEKYDKDRAGMTSEAVRLARASDSEYQRSKLGATEYLELYRAQMTREHDAEADVEFATSTFLNIVPADAVGVEGNKDWENYQHYVLSAAGGLGDNRTDRVRGKIIARAAGVEATQRRDIAYLGAKWAVPKFPLRNMVVGYHHNSDGYAIDRNGNQIETERGYLLNHDPSKLWWWEDVDPVNGPFFDWTDEKGNFITRVYKSNGPAMKELLSNFDIPINDPVNNLYTILTGINQGDLAKKYEGNKELMNIPGMRENLEWAGLGKLKTTLSKSLGVFKEKNAAFGPMIAEMAKKGLIKNATDLNIAYIDSVNKTVKTGNFNIQDGDAIQMMERIINKGEWGNVFRADEICQYENIDKEPLKGMDENGADVPAETATSEQIMRRIERKMVAPAAVKMVAMMSRITPNTLDNQKISTLEKWAKLVETAEMYWSDEIEESGYTGELKKVKRRFNDRIDGARNGGEVLNRNESRNEFNDRDRIRPGRPNHLMYIEEIYNNSLDGFSFVGAVDDYCNDYNLDDAAREFHEQIDDSMMIEELYRIAVSVFSRYLD